MPNISLIACVDSTGGLGNKGELLFNIPQDMSRFRILTKGHPVIMGRKTWDSIPEKFRPLPGRQNIVITSQKGLWSELYDVGANPYYACGISDAMRRAKESPGSDEIFVIGGERVYEDFRPFCNKIYLTEVAARREFDVLFRMDLEDFEVVFESANEHEGLEYKFKTYVRKV